MIRSGHDVNPGDMLPHEFDCINEIPFGSSVKYELDKTSGLIKLDRLLCSAVAKLTIALIISLSWVWFSTAFEQAGPASQPLLRWPIHLIQSQG